MQLAINYSPQASALLDRGVVHFDLYKCPDWDDVLAEARKQRPAYVHFPLHAGSGRMQQADWRRIEAYLEQTSTHYVNIHLAPHIGQFPGLHLDSDDRQWLDPMAERVIRDIELAIREFGRSRIILENVPYDPDPQYMIPRLATLPEFVTRVVDATGCGFLLDIAHARIAALYLEMGAYDYLDAMPVEGLREVHITGTAFDEQDAFWKDHTPMSEDDWALAEYVLVRIGRGEWHYPEIVALEYGGVGPGFGWRSKSEVIAVDMPRLAELARAVLYL